MVKPMPPMIDMARTPEEMESKLAPANAAPQAPIYPSGLSICLCDDELEKLKLDPDHLQRGDILHLFAFAKITSISATDTEAGATNRVELQITHLAGEDEDQENAAANKAPRVSKTRALYR